MITKEEIEWLNHNFPDLQVNNESNVIEGTVWFNSVYDKVANEFTAFPKPGVVYAGEMFAGKYEVKITKSDKKRRVPELQVFIDQSKWIPNRHFYDIGYGKACVAGPVEEDNLFTRYSFYEYFERFVIQFLYAQSYFDKHGKWPWFAYAHNAAGILESFSKSEKTKSQTLACLKRLKANRRWDEVRSILGGRFDGKKCLCGSKSMLNKCHANLVWVARDFCNTAKGYGINI
ncbi:MAG: hypothetical protein WD579_00615 [Candidatus Paceibacterota bacterium]